MKKLYDAVCKTGEYQKDGQTKGRYVNVGAVFQRDDGSQCLKLDALPLVSGDVWINFYEPRNQDQPASKPSGGGETPGGDLDFEIPFITPWPVDGLV